MRSISESIGFRIMLFFGDVDQRLLRISKVRIPRKSNAFFLSNEKMQHAPIILFYKSKIYILFCVDVI